MHDLVKEVNHSAINVPQSLRENYQSINCQCGGDSSQIILLLLHNKGMQEVPRYTLFVSLLFYMYVGLSRLPACLVSWQLSFSCPILAHINRLCLGLSMYESQVSEVPYGCRARTLTHGKL